ncbi:hypothetical protein D3C86_2004440 [compost metagenome]
MEGICAFDFLPDICTGKQYFQLAGQNFHRLGTFRTKLIYSRQHDAKRHLSAILQSNRAAGNFSIVINISCFLNCRVGELTHLLILPFVLNPSIIAGL